MTEYCILGPDGPGRDLGIDPALCVANTIHFDLTRGEFRGLAVVDGCLQGRL